MGNEYCGVGFLDELAVYYREGKIITFPISDLVISLLDSPLSSITEEYKRFIAPAGNVSYLRNVRQMEFFDLFSEAYRTLSSAGVLFQDWLVIEVRTSLEAFLNDQRTRDLVRSIEAVTWPDDISYANFDLNRFQMIFSMEEITESPRFPALMNSWAEQIYGRLKGLWDMQRAMDFLIQEYLLRERGESPSLINKYFVSECFSSFDFSSVVPDEKLAVTLAAIKETPDYGVSHIVNIADKGADGFLVGFESTFFRSLYDSDNILFRAFEHMCTKNIVLARCDICGKYVRNK